MKFYQTLEDNYGGIGEYWSYEHGGGCVYFNVVGHAQDILVKGLVSPRDVDWQATISLDSMDEKELRLNPNAVVQVNEIITWDANVGGNVRLPLKNSLLINV